MLIRVGLAFSVLSLIASVLSICCLGPLGEALISSLRSLFSVDGHRSGTASHKTGREAAHAAPVEGGPVAGGAGSHLEEVTP